MFHSILKLKLCRHACQRRDQIIPTCRYGKNMPTTKKHADHSTSCHSCYLLKIAIGITCAVQVFLCCHSCYLLKIAIRMTCAVQVFLCCYSCYLLKIAIGITCTAVQVFLWCHSCYLLKIAIRMTCAVQVFLCCYSCYLLKIAIGITRAVHVFLTSFVYIFSILVVQTNAISDQNEDSTLNLTLLMANYKLGSMAVTSVIHGNTNLHQNELHFKSGVSQQINTGSPLWPTSLGYRITSFSITLCPKSCQSHPQGTAQCFTHWPQL